MNISQLSAPRQTVRVSFAATATRTPEQIFNRRIQQYVRVLEQQKTQQAKATWCTLEFKEMLDAAAIPVSFRLPPRDFQGACLLFLAALSQHHYQVEPARQAALQQFLQVEPSLMTSEQSNDRHYKDILSQEQAERPEQTVLQILGLPLTLLPKQ